MSWDKPYKPLVALAWRYLQAVSVRGTCLAVCIMLSRHMPYPHTRVAAAAVEMLIPTNHSLILTHALYHTQTAEHCRMYQASSTSSMVVLQFLLTPVNIPRTRPFMASIFWVVAPITNSSRKIGREAGTPINGEAKHHAELYSR